METATVRIKRTDSMAERDVPAETGSLLSQVLQREGTGFALPCAGQGRCGKCKVRASGNLSEPDEGEKRLLSGQELSEGIRLACRTRVEGSCEVWLSGTGEAVILQEGRDVRIPEGEEPMFRKLGAAVDIGTTTIAAGLYDRSGQIARAGRVNPQLGFGADVISRIEKSLEGEGDALALAVREGIGELLEEMCVRSGQKTSEIDALVITGNTAMLYLLTGRNPESLSRAPFLADWLGDEIRRGAEWNLPCPEAKIYLPPCIGAFTGADLVTAILASGLCETQETKLLADIGTNGEIALWKDGVLYCCSTAAGPAFEGTGLSMGMPGKEGAISHVRLEDGELRIEVIGKNEPKGICGSGVIDAVSCLLAQGRLDETGYLEEEEVLLAGTVRINQEDIRKVQLAKSAICAGIKTLLHRAGLEADGLQELLVAGGFGSFLTLSNALRVGLLPQMPEEKITVCGNAALQGAAAILCGGKLAERAKRMAEEARLVDLTADVFFQDCYINEMFFE